MYVQQPYPDHEAIYKNGSTVAPVATLSDGAELGGDRAHGTDVMYQGVKFRRVELHGDSLGSIGRRR